MWKTPKEQFEENSHWDRQRRFCGRRSTLTKTWRTMILGLTLQWHPGPWMILSLILPFSAATIIGHDQPCHATHTPTKYLVLLVFIATSKLLPCGGCRSIPTFKATFSCIFVRLTAVVFLYPPKDLLSTSSLNSCILSILGISIMFIWISVSSFLSVRRSGTCLAYDWCLVPPSGTSTVVTSTDQPFTSWNSF